MSYLGESMVFAAIMTLLDELKEQEERNTQRDIAYERQKYSQYDDNKAKKIVIKRYKDNALQLFDDMIRQADKKSGTCSDLGAVEFLNMLLEAVMFFCIDSEYYSKSQKAKAIEYLTELADVKGICSESDGNYIFDEENRADIEDVFSKGIVIGTRLICQGSITSEIPNCLTDTINSICQLLLGLEVILNEELPSSGWNGKKMGNYLIERTIQSTTEMMNEKWAEMTPSKQKEVDYNRWLSEQSQTTAYTPEDSFEKTTSMEVSVTSVECPLESKNKDWSYLLMNEYDNPREAIKDKLRTCFDGKIVRKDLTKKIKEGANVPVYVLEFLLGQYCSSDDEDVIEQGVENVKRILADNFVRPDEAQKILSVLRARGSYTVIDKITVNLNIKKNAYEAEFSNLGLRYIPVADEYPEKYDRLLCGGIWCIIQLEYEYIEEDKKNGSPIQIRKLTPIQMPHIDIDELKAGRKAFTKDEWIDCALPEKTDKKCRQKTE